MSANYGVKQIGRTSADEIVSLTANTTITEASHAGRVMVLNKADGITVTLPAATGSGNVYRFIVGTAITSNTGVIKVANASDSFVGNVIQAADGGSTVVGWEIAANDDTCTLDGSTKGGIVGDRIEVIDIAANKFLVTGILSGTGTEATAFSATVS